MIGEKSIDSKVQDSNYNEISQKHIDPINQSIQQGSSTDFILLEETFGKKYYVLMELVLYEYLSKDLYKAHPNAPKRFYNLNEFTFTIEEKGLLITPKDPKRSIKGTLMQTKEIDLCLRWIEAIETNIKRSDNYYLGIIRSQRKIVVMKHQNSDCNMYGLAQHNLETNQSASMSRIFEPTGHFRRIDQRWLSSVLEAFTKRLMSSSISLKYTTARELLCSILLQSEKDIQQHLILKAEEIELHFENICEVFCSEILSSFYTKDHVKQLARKKNYFTNASFVLFVFIERTQVVLKNQIDRMNMQGTKKILVMQEQLIKNIVDDVSIVISSFFDDMEINFSEQVSAENQRSINKIFKLFSNEINCICSYVMHFIKDIFSKLYSPDQIQYLIDSVRNQSSIHYLNLGETIQIILETSKSKDKPEDIELTEDQVFYSLCSVLLYIQTHIEEVSQRMASTSHYPSVLGNVLSANQ